MAPVAIRMPAHERRFAKSRERAKRFLKTDEMGKDEEANLNIGAALGVAFLIVGAIVGAIIAAKLAPSYITAVANASQTVANADFGDDTANSLTGPMALVISISGLFGVVGLVIASIVLSRRK